MDKKYIKLFSTVILVKGIEKSALYNFKKPYVYPIPNILASILEMSETESINVVKDKFCFNKTDEIAFNKYIQFLEKNNLIFWTTQVTSFSNISTSYVDNSFISTSIIEYDFKGYDLIPLMRDLDQLLCKHIEIRFINILNYNFQRFESILKEVLETGFKSVDLIFHEDPIFLSSLLELKDIYKNLNRIIVNNSICNKSYSNKVINVFSDKSNFSEIGLKHVLDFKYFCEAHYYNPYFNKKVCIDHTGAIKNYILQQKSFGNINDDKLIDTIKKPDFKELWNVNHDQIINICDNPYRYSLYLPFELLKKTTDLYTINFDKIIY